MQKTSPPSGKHYDEATHQWVDSVELRSDSHAEPLAAPKIKPAAPNTKE